MADGSTDFRGSDFTAVGTATIYHRCRTHSSSTNVKRTPVFPVPPRVVCTPWSTEVSGSFPGMGVGDLEESLSLR